MFIHEHSPQAHTQPSNLLTTLHYSPDLLRQFSVTALQKLVQTGDRNMRSLIQNTFRQSWLTTVLYPPTQLSPQILESLTLRHDEQLQLAEYFIELGQDNDDAVLIRTTWLQHYASLFTKQLVNSEFTLSFQLADAWCSLLNESKQSDEFLMQLWNNYQYPIPSSTAEGTAYEINSTAVLLLIIDYQRDEQVLQKFILKNIHQINFNASLDNPEHPRSGITCAWMLAFNDAHCYWMLNKLLPQLIQLTGFRLKINAAPANKMHPNYGSTVLLHAFNDSEYWPGITRALEYELSFDEPDINFNATVSAPTRWRAGGNLALYIAAMLDRVDLIEQYVTKSPEAVIDFNCTMQNITCYEGLSVAWILAADASTIPLFKQLYAANPHTAIDLNGIPSEDCDESYGEENSIAWWLVYHGEFELLKTIIAQQPDTIIDLCGQYTDKDRNDRYCVSYDYAHIDAGIHLAWLLVIKDQVELLIDILKQNVRVLKQWSEPVSDNQYPQYSIPKSLLMARNGTLHLPYNPLIDFDATPFQQEHPYFGLKFNEYLAKEDPKLLKQLKAIQHVTQPIILNDTIRNPKHPDFGLTPAWYLARQAQAWQLQRLLTIQPQGVVLHFNTQASNPVHPDYGTNLAWWLMQEHWLQIIFKQQMRRTPTFRLALNAKPLHPKHPKHGVTLAHMIYNSPMERDDDDWEIFYQQQMHINLDLNAAPTKPSPQSTSLNLANLLVKKGKMGMAIVAQQLQRQAQLLLDLRSSGSLPHFLANSPQVGLKILYEQLQKQPQVTLQLNKSYEQLPKQPEFVVTFDPSFNNYSLAYILAQSPTMGIEILMQQLMLQPELLLNLNEQFNGITLAWLLAQSEKGMQILQTQLALQPNCNLELNAAPKNPKHPNYNCPLAYYLAYTFAGLEIIELTVKKQIHLCIDLDMPMKGWTLGKQLQQDVPHLYDILAARISNANKAVTNQKVSTFFAPAIPDRDNSMGIKKNNVQRHQLESDMECYTDNKRKIMVANY
ncbi:MAG: hypothetical protein P4L79_03875 [Legionella sp.]|uniref:hypothetical protein n=1 Tax=Legionella sp. TaxID=459 RepID=UPI00283BB8E9|nr:hypothetical protein [Legionella sp.]